jgi:hypothetical protein
MFTEAIAQYFISYLPNLQADSWFHPAISSWYTAHSNILTVGCEGMTKKITRLEDYISASDAASLLSAKLGRSIDPEYMTKLAKSKKQPIHTRWMGNRLLYLKSDIESVTIKAKQRRS